MTIAGPTEILVGPPGSDWSPPQPGPAHNLPDVASVTPPPPEPQTPPPTYAALAQEALDGFKGDPDWVKRYQAGGHKERQSMEAVHKLILGAKQGLTEEQLKPLADVIGLTKLPPLPDLPKSNPMQRANAQASDYQLPREIMAGAQSQPGLLDDAKAATEWAAGMKFLPGVGNSLLARIAEVEPKVTSMRVPDLQNWLAEQDRALVSRAGSEEAARQLLTDARQALTQIGYNHPWAARSDALAFRDAWTVTTLALHYRAHVATRGT